MGLFGRNKGGGGQNPLPTKGQIEANMVKIGDKWWPKQTVSGRDIYYPKLKQPQTPPIPPNARSFGNERPQREERKPQIDKTSDDSMMLKQSTITFNVEAGFEELYCIAISDIIKRRTNYYVVEVAQPGNIKATMLVSKNANDLINRDIKRDLCGEVE